MKNEIICRVCGFENQFDDVQPPWRLIDSDWYPSHEICPCCGCEFGFDDVYPLGVQNYRGHWISSGAKFLSPHLKPFDWELERQLNDIPKKWR